MNQYSIDVESSSNVTDFHKKNQLRTLIYIE